MFVYFMFCVILCEIHGNSGIKVMSDVTRTDNAAQVIYSQRGDELVCNCKVSIGRISTFTIEFLPCEEGRKTLVTYCMCQRWE